MDDDPPLNLGFEEAPAAFVSASQTARVWTEQWVHAQLFCPNCGKRPIRRFPGNWPVAEALGRASVGRDEASSGSARP